MSKYYGQSEERLREKFEEAQKNAPSVLFIDELDSIAPKREEVTGEVERRVVAQLLTLMDGLSGRGQVIVIGATNRDEAIDPALRRPGRFDREIEIGVPDRSGRKEILQIHTRGMPIEGVEEERDRLLSELADVCHGFVGADLAALAREAAMKTLRRYLPDIDLDKPIPAETLEKMRVLADDFKQALKEVEPSAMREVLVEVPRVNWTDVGGLEEVKMKLREAVEMPLKEPDAVKRMGSGAPRDPERPHADDASRGRGPGRTRRRPGQLLRRGHRGSVPRGRDDRLARGEAREEGHDGAFPGGHEGRASEHRRGHGQILRGIRQEVQERRRPGPPGREHPLSLSQSHIGRYLSISSLEGIRCPPDRHGEHGFPGCSRWGLPVWPSALHS